MKKRITIYCFSFIAYSLFYPVFALAVAHGTFLYGNLNIPDYPTSYQFALPKDKVWDATLKALSEWPLTIIEKDSGLINTDVLETERSQIYGVWYAVVIDDEKKNITCVGKSPFGLRKQVKLLVNVLGDSNNTTVKITVYQKVFVPFEPETAMVKKIYYSPFFFMDKDFLDETAFKEIWEKRKDRVARTSGTFTEGYGWGSTDGEWVQVPSEKTSEYELLLKIGENLGIRLPNVAKKELFEKVGDIITGDFKMNTVNLVKLSEEVLDLLNNKGLGVFVVSGGYAKFFVFGILPPPLRLWKPF